LQPTTTEEPGQLCVGIGSEQIDLFASDTNTQPPRFFSLYRCPGTSGVNALLQPWRGLNGFANPRLLFASVGTRHVGWGLGFQGLRRVYHNRWGTAWAFPGKAQLAWEGPARPGCVGPCVVGLCSYRLSRACMMEHSKHLSSPLPQLPPPPPHTHTLSPHAPPPHPPTHTTISSSSSLGFPTDTQQKGFYGSNTPHTPCVAPLCSHPLLALPNFSLPPFQPHTYTR